MSWISLVFTKYAGFIRRTSEDILICPVYTKGKRLYRRIYLFLIHARSQNGGTFLTLVACGVPCFPVTLLGGFVDNRILVKAGRTGETDNVPGSCSYNL